MAFRENQKELDISKPPYLRLISAFLAMEPPDVLLSFARGCGGGLIDKRVQRCIWNNCISNTVDDNFSEGNLSVVKRISFTVHDECSELSSCPTSKKLEFSLQCSVNMLEGDTGSVQVLVWLVYVSSM